MSHKYAHLRTSFVQCDSAEPLQWSVWQQDRAGHARHYNQLAIIIVLSDGKNACRVVSEKKGPGRSGYSRVM